MTRLRRRGSRSSLLRRNRRGVTLIELIVALVVIAVASVGTAIAFFNTWGYLYNQRLRMRANAELRQEVEYWQGRVHAAFPTNNEMQATGWREVILDERGPGASDDVVAQIRREVIVPHVYAEVTSTEQSYVMYEIPVVIKYDQPTWALDEDPVEVQYTLVGYWLPAGADPSSSQ